MVFFNHATRQMTAKIVYYGPGLCGKTTNLNIIYARTAEKSRGEMVSLNTETDRTLFFDLLPLEVGMVGGFKAKLQLYTVPGQVFYNSTRKLVLKGVDGIVFVADSQPLMLEPNRESLQNLGNNLLELGLELKDIPMVFQWNKRDLKNVVPVSVLEAELNPHGFPSFETVAQEGLGVFETLRGITRLALAQIKAQHLGELPSGRPLSPLEPSLAAAPAPSFTAALAPSLTPEATPVPEAPDWEPRPEALTADDVVMRDTQGEATLGGGLEALNFLDLPTAADLFAELPGAAEGAEPAPAAPEQALSLEELSPPTDERPAREDLALAAEDLFAPRTDEALPAWAGASRETLDAPAEPLPAVSEPAWSSLFDGPASPGPDLSPPFEDPAVAAEPSSAGVPEGVGAVPEPEGVGDEAPAEPWRAPANPGEVAAGERSLALEADDAFMNAPLFPDDPAPLGFPFDAFDDPAPGVGAIEAGPDSKPADGTSQVMAPLTVRLRAPQGKVGGVSAELPRPILATLRPSAPVVAPRSLAAPPRVYTPLPTLLNASRRAAVLHITLPQDLGEGDLEVTVVVRQNGATVGEAFIQRSAPQAGASATLNLELKRS